MTLGVHTSHALQRLMTFSRVKKVLVVGPNILRKDPSTLFLANQLRNVPDAKLVLLDLQGKKGEVKGSFGGLFENLLSFRELDRQGVPMLFPSSVAMDVRKIGTRDFDLLFDHFAHPFIGGAETMRHVKRRAGSKAVEDALNAYLRPVRPGGKIVLMTDSSYVAPIVSWLQQNRLRHTVRPVEDLYHVWVPPRAIDPLRRHFQDSVHSVGVRPHHDHHKAILRPTYACPFMITVRTPSHR